MTKEQTEKVLSLLDNTYGTEKDGFLHHTHWQLLFAIMLSAQSTDQQVDAALPGLFQRFPTLTNLAEASLSDIEEQIRSIGLYHSKAKNMKACSQTLLEQYGGEVPRTLKELITLPGVGRKTANLFLADAFGVPGITVDTHVKRISNRLGWTDSSDPYKVELALQKVLPVDHWIRINIQLIRHGRAVCKAQHPKCSECMLSSFCPSSMNGGGTQHEKE